ncbi:cytochrome-c oxidase [Sphingomonas sp. DBB INV C78]|uniref:cytochrome c oxidase subunit II n=1 Tax=Sphingomonas sp. DBB INV C78 TaxID=3349434 RepID=UPI0036D2B26A
MVVAIVIALLVLGSIIFHLASPWWQTPLASNWGSIDTALNVTLWICAAAFVTLNLFMAWSIYRYRHRPGHTAHYEPENTRLEKRLTFWTGIGIAGMLAPGLVAWHEYVTVPANAAVVEATGQQWQWGFRFPGKDGVLGTTNVRHMSPENPFGLSPRDPHGRDDILIESPDLRLPIDRPVKMVLRSKDVLHDFYVPQFRAKMDLVPGIVTYFWVTPTKIGTYEILCAELCGTGHHMMRGTVTVVSGREFDSWLAEQPTYSQLLAQARTDETRLAQADPTGRVAKGVR